MLDMIKRWGEETAKGAKEKKGGAQAQRPPSLQRPLASQYKINPETGYMMDMMQDQDWSLCDKDCGWCGHCAEVYDF